MKPFGTRDKRLPNATQRGDHVRSLVERLTNADPT
jgi:hypothetical protein